MFTCTTLMNRETISECIDCILKKFRTYLIIAGIGVSIFALFLCYVEDLSMIFGLVLVACIVAVYTYLYKRRRKNSIDTYCKQLTTVYHVDQITQEFVIDQENITIKAFDRERPYAIQDIKNVQESENFVIVIFEGSLLCFLDKRTLQGGNVEQLRALLGK